MDNPRIPPAGDPFTAKTPKPAEERLAELQDRLRHELRDAEERMELLDELNQIKRKEH